MFRDYDFITNNYKQLNDQKQGVDRQIEKLSAAEKYWKVKDYDIIKAKYLDDKKERAFSQHQEDLSKSWGKEYINRIDEYVRG